MQNVIFDDGVSAVVQNTIFDDGVSRLITRHPSRTKADTQTLILDNAILDCDAMPVRSPGGRAEGITGNAT